MKQWITENNLTLTQVLGGRSNVFLLSNGQKKILIDTGTKGQWKKLDNRLKSLDITSIDYLLLTHTHHDHAANADKIRIRYGAYVIVQKSEANNLAEGKAVIPKGTNPYSRILVNVLGGFAARLFAYSPCPYSILVDDYFDLKELGFDAYLIHTPGHSEGSVSLILNNEIAIIGDVMIGRGEYYTYPPFADNPVLLIKSWKKLLDTPCQLFIPSHGFANSRELVEKVYGKKFLYFGLSKEAP